MSATNAFETALLTLIFLNTAAANIGDASGLQPSATAGNFHVSIHTADPGEAGNQTSNEANYTSYARVAVPRSGSGWAVTNDTADNAAAITYPQATGGSNTATHFGIGFASSGTGSLNIYGALTAALAISTGITPEFAAGALDITLA